MKTALGIGTWKRTSLMRALYTSPKKFSNSKFNISFSYNLICSLIAQWGWPKQLWKPSMDSTCLEIRYRSYSHNICNVELLKGRVHAK